MPIPRLLPLLAAAILLAACHPRAAAQSSRPAADAARARADTVPFKYEDVRLYVPVRIAGAPARWLILDTGASPTVLDVGLADSLDLDVRDAGTTTGAGRNRMRQGRAPSATLDVGGIPLVVPSLAIAPLDSLLAPYTGRRAPGIVGSQFFREHVVEIDFATRRAVVRDTAGFRYEGAGVEIPVRFVGGVPIADGTLTLPDGRQVPARLLVDLGAKATLLVSEPFLERHRVLAAVERSVLLPLGAGVGGETRYNFARLPRLEVGAGRTVALDDLVAGLSAEGTLRSTWYDALLGAEFLERFRVVLDYARDRIILEPRPDAGPAAELDMSGMYLVARGPALRRFVVHRVLEDGPAAAAGVREGDVLAAVDGRPASEYRLGDVRDLLRSAPGREVPLVVEREGRRVGLVVTLQRLL